MTDYIKNLVTQMGASAIVNFIVPTPDKLDAKFAIEVGVSVMLDKPMIALVQPGMTIPRKLAAIVDRFIEYQPGKMDQMAEAIRDAMIELGFTREGT